MKMKNIDENLGRLHCALKVSKDSPARNEDERVLQRMYEKERVLAHKRLNERHRERMNHIYNAQRKNQLRIDRLFKIAHRKVERQHSEELRVWRETYPRPFTQKRRRRQGGRT